MLAGGVWASVGEERGAGAGAAVAGLAGVGAARALLPAGPMARSAHEEEGRRARELGLASVHGRGGSRPGPKGRERRE